VLTEGSRSSSGRALKVTGPATANARRPYVLSRCRGTTSRWRASITAKCQTPSKRRTDSLSVRPSLRWSLTLNESTQSRSIKDDEEAVVLACANVVFRSLDLHQPQGNNFWKKWGGHVHRSARCGTPLNTCRASRTCRDERVSPCCPTSATRLVTERKTAVYLYTKTNHNPIEY